MKHLSDSDMQSKQSKPVVKIIHDTKVTDAEKQTVIDEALRKAEEDKKVLLAEQAEVQFDTIVKLYKEFERAFTIYDYLSKNWEGGTSLCIANLNNIHDPIDRLELDDSYLQQLIDLVKARMDELKTLILNTYSTQTIPEEK